MTSQLRRCAVLAGAAALLLSACAGEPLVEPAAPPTGAAAAPGTPPPGDPAVAPTAPPTQEPAEEPPGPVSFAFVGDIHADGSAERVLTDGLGIIADLLAEHDVVVGNLETAILTDPSAAKPAPKQYTFAAPPELLATLHENGVDVVTLANNHGMDFGREGLRQTLEAAAASPLALVGAGQDIEAAYAPWVTEVDGARVAVLAATDVLDSFAIDTWPATADQAGLASTKGDRQQRFLDAVSQAAEQADVVAVYLHWGVEREVCPTARQQELAAAVADAGADVVVGSHAHVVQPAGQVDGTFVHYGLGNFVWYARQGPSAQTGVLSVEVAPDGTEATWHEAQIRSGIPVLSGTSEAPPTRC
jgi:poly-gamma-glutamate capsule biosynthesis protein CapA/YwtB (metallophosphatase superfamily)